MPTLSQQSGASGKLIDWPTSPRSLPRAFVVRLKAERQSGPVDTQNIGLDRDARPDNTCCGKQEPHR